MQYSNSYDKNYFDCRSNNNGFKSIWLWKKTPEEKFWDWFVKNKNQFEINEENKDKVINKISERLNKYQAGLAGEVSREENGIRELVISADGMKENFPAAENLVSSAPEVERWRIVAFRTRFPEGFVLEAQGLVLDPEKMFFSPIVDGKELDIIIYINDLDKYDFNKLSYFRLIVVDNLLGEYDCVTKVRSYDFHNLPPEDERSDLLPLNQLSIYVYNFHHKFRNK